MSNFESLNKITEVLAELATVEENTPAFENYALQQLLHTVLFTISKTQGKFTARNNKFGELTIDTIKNEITVDSFNSKADGVNASTPPTIRPTSNFGVKLSFT